VPSSADNPAGIRRDFWRSIARICAIEILVLLLLSAAALSYLNWSSKVAFAEFLSESELALPAQSFATEAVKSNIRCELPG